MSEDELPEEALEPEEDAEQAPENTENSESSESDPENQTTEPEPGSVTDG